MNNNDIAKTFQHLFLFISHKEEINYFRKQFWHFKLFLMNRIKYGLSREKYFVINVLYEWQLRRSWGSNRT